jgi:hypothetical protein
MKAETKNGRIYISLKQRKSPTPSRSGKSLVVASTRGVRISNIMVKGKPLRIVATAFIYIRASKKRG